MEEGLGDCSPWLSIPMVLASSQVGAAAPAPKRI